MVVMCQRARRAAARTGVPLAWLVGSFVAVASCTLVACAGRLHAAPIEIAQITRTEPVDFQKEIVPILRRKCLACHSASERQGELVLETPQSILKGGDTGSAVVAGRSADSLLLKLASHREEPFMPPTDNDVAASPLTPQELALIKLWIDQGAKGNAQNATLSPTNWRPLPSGVNPIYAVAVTPDGQYAACGRANQIFIYHVPTGQLVTRLTDPSLQVRAGDPRPGVAHLDLVQSLAFNAAGDMLASGGFRTVKLWRRPRDVVRLQLDTDRESVTAVAVSPDRKLLGIGAGHDVTLWDLSGGTRVRTLQGHTATVTDLRFTADGTQLLSSSLDQTVRAWSVLDGALRGRLDIPAAINAIELVNATDGESDEQPWLAIGDVDNLVRIYHPPTLSESIPNVPANPTAVATTADFELLAVVGADGLVRVMDQKGNVRKEWKVPGAPIKRLAFHPPVSVPEGGQRRSESDVGHGWERRRGAIMEPHDRRTRGNVRAVDRRDRIVGLPSRRQTARNRRCGRRDYRLEPGRRER